MSKGKKTRQQKIIADLRRQLVSASPNKPSQYTLTSHATTVHVSQTALQSAGSNVYPFFLSDLHKTIIVTAAVIVVEFVLFFLLSKHVISIPMVNY